MHAVESSWCKLLQASLSLLLSAAAQVASLDTLARLYIARFQYADAAAVYAALAARRAGLGDQAVDLAERLDLYQNAVLQACFPATHVSS